MDRLKHVLCHSRENGNPLPVIARRDVVPTWQSRKKNSKKCYEIYYFLDCHAP
ncbi:MULTISPECIES: hypothetical protein [unclassified Rickettsia]|uniref:hypothetical protein n=1 Tax=unclassified Rickettsia TaxID=114295 RepID=UPI0031335301